MGNMLISCGKNRKCCSSEHYCDFGREEEGRGEVK